VYGIACVILRIAVLMELRLVTDRQPDGQTDGHTMTEYTALSQRHAVRIVKFELQ